MQKGEKKSKPVPMLMTYDQRYSDIWRKQERDIKILSISYVSHLFWTGKNVSTGRWIQKLLLAIHYSWYLGRERKSKMAMTESLILSIEGAVGEFPHS